MTALAVLSDLSLSAVVASLLLVFVGSAADVAYTVCLAAWFNRDKIPFHFNGTLVLALVATLCVVLFFIYIIPPLQTTNALGSWDAARWHGRPLLFPARTNHARFFPEKHKFSYSYLVVGIPVGWEASCGGLISADGIGQRRRNSRSWYHIAAGEYLERGNGHWGLRGKLDDYLKKQNIDPSIYPYAYLVTAAKFLGYSFNPVSFWYLYSSDRNLAAVICEVNNTFDERRMYFLTPDSDMAGLIDVANKSTEGTTLGGRTYIRQSWTKDFHVSPFNSRKGSYSIVAKDPLSKTDKGSFGVDTTITLASSKGHAKLVARLFSTGPAVDPTALSTIEKLKFLSWWWWVGFVTFPWIVREAGVLFFIRGLHVWFRPEPLSSSIGRNGDSVELGLEAIFRQYLRSLVEQAASPLVVRYVSGGTPDSYSETMQSPAARSKPDDAQELEFRVLTPVFYTRFVHYAHDFEAVFGEFRSNCTLSISNADLLPQLVLRRPSAPVRSPSLADFVLFKIIQRLRRLPGPIERPLTSSARPSGRRLEPKGSDIRGFRISAMDGYVLENCDRRTRKAYRGLVFRTFLADRIAFGNDSLLHILGATLRAVAIWATAKMLARIVP